MEEAVAEVVVAVKKTRKPKAEKSTALVDTQQIQADEAYAKQVLEVVSGWDISTQDEMNQAGELLAEVVAKGKELEARLKTITGPMREAEQQVRNLFKPAVQFCASSEAALKKSIGTYERNRIAEQDAALKLIAESGGQADADTLVIAHGADQLQLAEQVSVRRVLKFRVTDAALIPDKYYVRILNEKAINEEVKLTEGQCVIPGVEVYVDIQVANKAVR